ncbi:MAG TPA: hypothetical protein VEF04_09765, partial [Blastocatellia bacterium]|nr:hypothetical protein [Blastocatellia bacterium]
NSLPTALVVAVNQPSGVVTRQQIATVSDPDQSPGALTVSLAQMSGSGITLGNLSVDAGGKVFADVAAACLASNATFTLTVRDDLGEAATTVCTIHPTAAVAPILGTYQNVTVGQSANLNILASTRPSDDGGISSLVVSASAGFAGQLRINTTTGTVTVNNANPPGNYTITVVATDACGLATTRSFKLTVNQITTTVINTDNCFSQGATVKIESQITHYGSAPVNGFLILNLPTQLAGIPNACQSAPATGDCTNEPSSLHWNGTIASGQTVKLTFDTQLVTLPPTGSSLSISSFVSFDAGATASYEISLTINTSCDEEPGMPNPATATVSDDKPGSVLFFPLYSSTHESPQTENTRINLTNLDKTNLTRLQIFFVNNNGGVASSSLCLGPTQTVSFLVSDYDPGVRGYILAVAVDQNGRPIKFNHLVGSEQVKLSSGHAASLNAIAFSAIAETPVTLPPGATTATLKFDGENYNAAPRTVALSNIPSPIDGNETLLFLDLFGGNLSAQNVGTLGDFTGLIYDDEGKSYSFSFNSTQNQFQKVLSDSFPRTQPRWLSAVNAGRNGWMRFASTTNKSVIGVSLSKTTNLLPYTQGHNLHFLDLINTVTLTIPLFQPICQ